VGIVNASPSTPLDVGGTGQFTNTSAGASATAIKLQNLDNTIGSATSLDFAPYGSGTVTNKIEGGHDGSNKFSLRFQTYSSGLAERMRIDGDGNVGIGTSNPVSQLMLQSAVNSTGYTEMLRLEGQNLSNGWERGIAFTGNTGGLEVSRISSYLTGTERHLRFTSAGTLGMTIRETGEVGIGTTNPAGNKLSVEGGANGGGVYQRLKHTGSAGQNNTSIFNISTASNTNSMEVNEQYNYSAFRHYGNLVNHYSDVNNHYFRTKGGVAKMTIDSAGKVTIPNQPHALFEKTTNTTVSSGAAPQIIFNEQRINTGSTYSSVNGRFTAPVAGVYLISVELQYTGQVNQGHLGIYLNGGAPAPLDVWINFGQDMRGMTRTLAINMAQNDYLTIHAHNGSSSGTLEGQRCRASFYLLG
jgi:hypothetical protein